MSRNISTRSCEKDICFKLSDEISRLRKRKGCYIRNEDVVSKVKNDGLNQIYITNRNSANETQTILQYKIVAVLTLGLANRLDEDVIEEIPMAYEIIDANDCSTFDNISDIRERVFPMARKFFKRWLKYGNVLIHCTQGVCRSPLVVLDYLLNVKKVGIETAIDSVVSERLFVFPENSLLLQSLQ